jgi:hypothetical protein
MFGIEKLRLMVTYKEAGTDISIVKCCLECFSTDVIPEAVREVSEYCRMFKPSSGNIHVNWAFFSEHFFDGSQFVIEGNVGSNFLHESHFFIRTSGADDFQSIRFCQLNDEAG